MKKCPQVEIIELQEENKNLAAEIAGLYVDMQTHRDYAKEQGVLIDIVEAKFVSANSVPVERVTITRKEWEALGPAQEKA